MAIYSDHSMLLLQCSMAEVRRSFPFRFKNSWSKEAKCRAIMVGCWAVNGTVLERLELCAKRLQEWGRRRRDVFRSEITRCHNELEQLRSLSGWDNSYMFLNKKKTA